MKKNSFKNDISNISQYTKIKCKLGKGGSAEVFMLEDKDGNCIAQKVYKKKRINHMNVTFPTEVKIMKILSGNKHFPELLYYDKKNYTIYMTLCGNKLSHDNIPKDWKEQLKEILDILKKNNISHNSTSINNTCVKDGIMYFIDFAHSGEYKARKRNLTKKIIDEATTFEDAYDVNKTRHISKREIRAKEKKKEDRRKRKAKNLTQAGKKK